MRSRSLSNKNDNENRQIGQNGQIVLLFHLLRACIHATFSLLTVTYTCACPVVPACMHRCELVARRLDKSFNTHTCLQERLYCGLLSKFQL